MCVNCKNIAEESSEGQELLLLILSFSPFFLHILNYRSLFFFSFSPVTGLVSMGLVQLLLPISQALYQWLVHLLPHQPVQCPPQQCLLPFLAAPGAHSLALLGTAPTPWHIPLPALAPRASPSQPVLQALQPLLLALQPLLQALQPPLLALQPLLLALQLWLLALQPCQPSHPDTGPRLCLCSVHLPPEPGAGVPPCRAGSLLGTAPEQSVLAVCSAGCAGISLQDGTTYPCAELTPLTPSWFLGLC